MSESTLRLLSLQSGQTLNPSKQDGAVGGGNLDVDQRACELGAPVPIVFARRRNDKGGILIAPGATEARFENNAANDVTAYYHLVISEGEIDSIAVKDVFQRACRLGSHTQTYDRRAGIWLPGNYIVERVGFDKPEASSYCGSVGVYSGMSTVSFENTVPNGFDQWRKQVHIFIRGGMHVTRLVDSVVGPSDNFADLVLWILQNSGRVPAALIDQPAFLSAATFLEANGFTCNIEIKESNNILDFISEYARYFLLGESNSGGKKGLRPLLPTNANGTIKTTAIIAEYTFDETLISPDSFSIDYINYADRLPFVAQMTWRQELATDAAILRTSEVRFVNAPAAGPFETYDLSEFCTSEDHAVKIGAYIVARRATVSHNIAFTAKPEAHNTLLTPGSIIRVVLSRDSNNEAPSKHDYLYQVERITKTLTGEVGYECSHFPIDSQGRSIVGLYVANTVGNGVLFAANQTGVTCDLPGRDTDNTIPDEEFTYDDDLPGWTWDPDTETWVPDTDIPGWTWDPDTDEWVLDPLEPNPDPEPDPEPDPMPLDPPLDGFDPPIDLDFPELDFGGGGLTGDGLDALEPEVEENPVDELDGQGESSTATGPDITGTNGPGNTLSYDPGCPGAYIEWRLIDSTTGAITVVSQGVAATYIPNNGAIGKTVVGVGKCPDPSSPTGYGPEISSPPLLITDGFVPVPNPGATVGWIMTTQLWSNGRNNCGSNTFYDSGLIASSVSSGSYANIVGYRVLDQYSTANYVCGGPQNSGTDKNIGVMLKRANGTEILVGSLQNDNVVASGSGVYGITRTYNLVDLTYLGVSFYTAPAVETPPWSP